MSNQPRDPGLGEALTRGFGLMWRAPGVVGLALLAEVASLVLGLGLQLLLAALALRALVPLAASLSFGPFGAPPSATGVPGGGSLPAVAGAAIAAGLVILTLRLFWVSAAARFYGLRLSGEEARFGLGLGAERLARAAQVGLLYLPLWLAVTLFGATVMGAGGLAFVRTVERGSGGVLGAALLALGLVLALFVNKAADLLLRLWLVRAVAADQAPLPAFGGAWQLLLARAGTMVALLVVFGILEWLAAAIAGSGSVFFAGEGAAAVALSVGMRLGSGLLGGALFAALATAELGAVATIDAGRRGGLLPPPSPPPPAPAEPRVLESEPILSTEVVLSTEPA